MSEIKPDHNEGSDVMILHLPEGLPEVYVPAEIWNGTETRGAGDHVTIAYQDQSGGLLVMENQIRTDGAYAPRGGMYGGTALTVYDPIDYATDNEYKNVLNKGDSGGGVFYDGYFVGVASYVDLDNFGWFMAFEQP